jgi:hypothetical protein
MSLLAVGAVRTLELDAGSYAVEINPEHHLGETDLAGNPPRRFLVGVFEILA